MQQETKNDMTASSDSERSHFWNAWRVFNYIVGALSLAILLMAFWLPPEIGGRPGAGETERSWQVAAAVAFILALLVIVKRVNYSLLLLIGSCAFFFVSCVANFHWKGG